MESNEAPKYLVKRDEDGQLLGVCRIHDNAQLPPDLHHPGYQEFLDWNGRQMSQLDVSKFLFPPGHIWFDKVEALTVYCKTNGLLLFNAARRGDPGVLAAVGTGDFPGKGYSCRLQIA